MLCQRHAWDHFFLTLVSGIFFSRVYTRACGRARARALRAARRARVTMLADTCARMCCKHADAWATTSGRCSWSVGGRVGQSSDCLVCVNDDKRETLKKKTFVVYRKHVKTKETHAKGKHFLSKHSS